MKTPSNTKLSFIAVLLTTTVLLLLPTKVSSWGWKQDSNSDSGRDPSHIARDCTRKINREIENASDLQSDPNPDDVGKFIDNVNIDLTSTCQLIPSGSFKINQDACGNASDKLSDSLDDLQATIGNYQDSKDQLDKVKAAMNAVVTACDRHLLQ